MPPERVLITGASGFAGSHLLESLLADGRQVFVLHHQASSHVTLPDHPRLEMVTGDLLDAKSLNEVVRYAAPDAVYHLAGQALTAASWGKAALTLQVNTIGTVHLLEAVVDFGRPRVVVVTSAEFYGPVQPEELPITEHSRPRPQNPYGVSKWAASQLIPLYQRRYELPVVEARPFNHIGPRQAKGFVVADFASQLAGIKLGLRPPAISVGNLSAERDFTDVRDVARAYRLLAELGQPGRPYLICSGKAVSIRSILERLIELAGVDVDVSQDPLRMRPSDTPRIVGSYERIKRDTGWEPQISLSQSLADALDDWLTRLADAAPDG